MLLILINIAEKNANIKERIKICIASYQDQTVDDSMLSMDS